MRQRKDKPIRMWALRRKSDGKWWSVYGKAEWTMVMERANFMSEHDARAIVKEDTEDVVPVLVTVREERPVPKRRPHR